MTLSTQTIEQLIASEKASSDAQVVAHVNGRAVTRRELSAAFDLVADPTNWKNRIDAVILTTDVAELALISEAVTFFAGCVPTFTNVACNRTHVRAKGYYAAVGA